MNKENIRLNLEIVGIERPQANELIAELSSIEGVNVAGHYLNESIQVKELCAPIVVIAEGVIVGVIANIISEKIKKFFDKEKSIDNEPIMIESNNIQIMQGDSIQVIENKINLIIINQHNKK